MNINYMKKIKECLTCGVELNNSEVYCSECQEKINELWQKILKDLNDDLTEEELISISILINTSVAISNKKTKLKD